MLKFLRWVWGISACVIIIVACLFSALRLSLPLMNHHRQAFEQYASGLLGQPVHIQKISAWWRGMDPVIVFNQVTINNAATPWHLNQLRVRINLFESIRHWRWIPGKIILEGAAVNVAEESDGQLEVDGFTAGPASSTQAPAVIAWLLSQPHIQLDNMTIHWQPFNGADYPIVLRQLDLTDEQPLHVVTGVIAGLNGVVSGGVQWSHNAQGGWDIQSRPTELRFASGTPTHISFHITKSSASAPIQRSFTMDHLAIADVGALIPVMPRLAPAVQAAWNGLKPEGVLQDIAFADQGSLNDWSTTSISASFSEVGIHAWKSIPSVSPLSGQFSFAHSQGDMQLASSHLQVDATPLFSHAFLFNQASAQLHVSQNTQGVWVVTVMPMSASNADMTIDGTANFIFGPHPTMQVSGKFNVNNALHVHDYLPLGKTSASLQAWLAQALDAGHVAGTVMIHGPFSQPEIQVHTQFDHLSFHYLPQWPELTDLQGQLIFNGKNIRVDANAATILGAPLKNAMISALIPLQKDSVVHVQASVLTNADQAVQLIHASPLESSLGSRLKLFLLTGDLGLNVGIDIPTTDTKATQMSALVNFKDNALSITHSPFMMTQMDGSLHVGPGGTLDAQLTGRLFDAPAVLTLSVPPADKKLPTTMDVAGHVSSDTLASYLPASMKGLLKGASDFQLQARIPPAQDPQVMLTSNLAGMAIDLPAPFGKTAAETAPFLVETTLADKAPLAVSATYKDQLQAALVWHDTPEGGLSFYGGNVHVGRGEASRDDQAGVRVTGYLQNVNWNTWSPALKYFNVSSDGSHFFRGANLKIQTLSAYDQVLSPAALGIQPDPAGIKFVINSPEIVGNIVVPSDHTKPLLGSFDQLSLSKKSSTSPSAPLLPQDIPPMMITAKQCSYNHMDLGSVDLQLLATPDGLGRMIKGLTLQSPNLDLDVTGSWIPREGVSQTKIVGNFSSDDVKQLLTELKINSNFLGSTGSGNFHLSWNDAPFRMSTASLSGGVDVSLGKGEIINLGKKASEKLTQGRLLSIFSLHSLSNRLDELSQPGYSFEKMTGHYTIVDGNLNTTDTHFVGTVADIGISGRIGLAMKDYDLRVFVTPHSTSSLPVIAGVIGGPLALGITWAVSKVMDGAINQMTTVDYAMTGSWQNPSFKSLMPKTGAA